MTIVFWTAIFLVSLVVMIKGADWFLEGAEKIGLRLGLSPFIVGVVIVGLGTSFPELTSSLIATLKNQLDVAPANAIGSNIANILLITGIAAQFAKGQKLEVRKDLIAIDIPLLLTGTALFIFTAIDGQITFLESLLLLITYGVYLLYTFVQREEHIEENGRALLRAVQSTRNGESRGDKINLRDMLFLIVGIVALIVGAKYVIDAVVELATILNVATGLITVTAVAIGTSLPELFVSVRAAMAGKGDVALGNIFGSNVFNMFVVIGIPGLFSTLTIDPKTFMIGLPVLAVSTILFVISGISRKIYIWEGAFFLAFYVLFIGKLFNLI